MAWAKLDDQILDHPKIKKVGAMGFALHVAGIVYCAKHLTNGFIPREAVGTLLDWPGSWPPVPQIVAMLLTEQLWHERDRGYQVHDYLRYNPPKEVVLAKRRGAAIAPGLLGSSSGSPEDRKKTRVFTSSTEAEKNKDPKDPVRLSDLLTGRLAALLKREVTSASDCPEHSSAPVPRDESLPPMPR